jgi:hypothetical protein
MLQQYGTAGVDEQDERNVEAGHRKIVTHSVRLRCGGARRFTAEPSRLGRRSSIP